MPRGTRWLACGIAAVVLTLAVVWVLFVPAADWLAHHDVGSVTGSLHETALDNARGLLLTLGVGLFAAGALVFTARNFAVSRRTLELTEQGQVTDRYTKAIEQLGSDKLDVRIGGIYALERVARDSGSDHPTVMEVLAAFIREHSREQWPVPEPGMSPARAHPFPRPDVQAALTVIGRRDVKQDQDQRDIDLTAAVLPSALLFGADLTRVRLVSANLRHAIVHSSAKLTDADLRNADLSGADLSDADLTRADLRSADLAGANLRAAHLTGAHLGSANLRTADLTRADLTGTILIGADLTGARWPKGAPDRKAGNGIPALAD